MRITQDTVGASQIGQIGEIMNKSLTVEFTVTGLDAEQQQRLQHDVLSHIIAGTRLLNINAPNTMCGMDGKVASRLTCTIDPPLDGVIPGCIVKDELTGVLEAVVLEQNAEEMLLEIISAKGEVETVEPRVGERVWAKKGSWKPTGAYYLANEPEDGILGGVPGKMVRRLRPGGYVDGSGLEVVLQAGFSGKLV